MWKVVSTVLRAAILSAQASVNTVYPWQNAKRSKYVMRSCVLSEDFRRGQIQLGK